MFYRKTIFIILIMLITSCGKKNPTGPDEHPEIPSEPVTVSVTLPSNVQINKSDLQILTPTKTVSIGEQEQYQTTVVQSEKTQVVGVIDKAGNLTLLGYHKPGETQIEISARSTAQTLILMMPLFLFTSLEQRLEIVSRLETRNDFATLVSYIENVLANDPENALNYSEHPLIYQQAASIAIAILKEYSMDKSLHKNSSPLKNPWIEDAEAGKLTFVNPKTVHYASSIKHSENNSQIELLLLDAKPSLVSYQFGWPPIYWTPPVSTTTQKDIGDGNFVIYLTKGFDFQDLSNFFNWDMPDGRASLANIGKGFILVIDLTIGYLPTSPITQLRLDATQTSYYLIKMGKAYSEGDVLDYLYNFIRLMAENVDQICYWLWQDAASDAARAYASKLFGILENVALAIKIVTTGETALNQFVPFLYDIIFDERTLTFFVSQSNGQITTNTQNSNPDTPDSPQGPQYASVNETVSFTTRTYDSDMNNIAYRFYWGDGNISPWSSFVTSGTGITISHAYASPGVYQVAAEAKDVFGAVSGFSPTATILINPHGSFFYYTFDDDVPGSFPSSPPWTIDQQTPSYLTVNSSKYWGTSGNSCAFYDYDPDLGTEAGEYTMIWAELQNNPKGTVEFTWQIEAAEDDFGLRAWESWDWEYMAYYVLFYNGQLSYYDDGNFIPIYSTSPGTWYQMKLVYDLYALSYNVFINGVLVKSDIPFVGNPSSINMLQIVAFSDASCRTGYIDEIRLSQQTIFHLAKRSAKIPATALKIRPE